MDITMILSYLVAVLFNIWLVAKVRTKAYEAGRTFLASGRFAVFLVFGLCFLELLVTGRFEALQDPLQFTDLMQRAWLMAGGAVGTHIIGKTAVESVTR